MRESILEVLDINEYFENYLVQDFGVFCDRGVYYIIEQ